MNQVPDIKDPDTYAFCSINNIPYPSGRYQDPQGIYFKYNGVKYYEKDFNLDKNSPIVKEKLAYIEKSNENYEFRRNPYFNYLAVIMKKLNITEDEMLDDIINIKKEKNIKPPSLEETKIETNGETSTWFKLF